MSEPVTVEATVIDADSPVPEGGPVIDGVIDGIPGTDLAAIGRGEVDGVDRRGDVSLWGAAAPQPFRIGHDTATGDAPAAAAGGGSRTAGGPKPAGTLEAITGIRRRTTRRGGGEDTPLTAAAVTGIVHAITTGRTPDHQSVQALSVHLGPGKTSDLLRSLKVEADGQGRAGGFTGKARLPRRKRGWAAVRHWAFAPAHEQYGLPLPLANAVLKVAGRQPLTGQEHSVLARTIGQDGIALLTGLR